MYLATVLSLRSWHDVPGEALLALTVLQCRALGHHGYQAFRASILSSSETCTLTLGKALPKSGFLSSYLSIDRFLFIFFRKLVPGVLCSFGAILGLFSESPKIW